jgi:hypothetical protein
MIVLVAVLAGPGQSLQPRVTSSSIFNLGHLASDHFLATSHVLFPESNKHEASGIKNRTSYWRFVTAAGQSAVSCGDQVRLMHVDSGRFLVAT